MLGYGRIALLLLPVFLSSCAENCPDSLAKLSSTVVATDNDLVLTVEDLTRKNKGEDHQLLGISSEEFKNLEIQIDKLRKRRTSMAYSAAKKSKSSAEERVKSNAASREEKIQQLKKKKDLEADALAEIFIDMEISQLSTSSIFGNSERFSDEERKAFSPDYWFEVLPPVCARVETSYLTNSDGTREQKICSNTRLDLIADTVLSGLVRGDKKHIDMYDSAQNAIYELDVKKAECRSKGLSEVAVDQAVLAGRLRGLATIKKAAR